jgi:hypothetical protein
MSERMLGQISATRRQLFEHSQYQCPRMMLMLPEKIVNKWSPVNWFTEPYRLYLLCEHDDGMHFTEHEGYIIREPKEFLIKVAPVLSGTLHILDIALACLADGFFNIPTSLFLFLNSIQRSPAQRLIKYNDADDDKQRVQKTASYLNDYQKKISPIIEQQCADKSVDSRLIGASFRELQGNLHFTPFSNNFILNSNLKKTRSGAKLGWIAIGGD